MRSRDGTQTMCVVCEPNVQTTVPAPAPQSALSEQTTRASSSANESQAQASITAQSSTQVAQDACDSLETSAIDCTLKILEVILSERYLPMDTIIDIFEAALKFMNNGVAKKSADSLQIESIIKTFDVKIKSIVDEQSRSFNYGCIISNFKTLTKLFELRRKLNELKY